MSLLVALGWANAAGVCGYVVGAALGMLAVATFSQNRHDRSQEIGMTGFFFTGPVGGALGAAAGFAAYWLN